MRKYDLLNRMMRGMAFPLSVITAVALGSCTDGGSGTIFPPGTELQAGDIVFRRGGGFASHAVLYADSNGAYSHIGIVVDSAGTSMVVHAVPGEPDYKGDEDRVKMESAEEFYRTYKADIGCVMRCGDSLVARKAAENAVMVYRRGTLFDHEYDDRDTTLMYCSELVEHAYAKAGMPLAKGQRHDINLPGLDFRHVILPSDISGSDALHLVVAF